MPPINIIRFYFLFLLSAVTCLPSEASDREVIVGDRVASWESVVAECHGDTAEAAGLSRPVPFSGSYRTATVREVERAYNLLHVRWWGTVAGVVALIGLAFTRCKGRGRYFLWLPVAGLGVSFMMECILDAGPPMSSVSSTLMGVALVCGVISMRCTDRRVILVLAIVESLFCLAGAMLWHHPSVRPLNPALVSVWLPVHVSFMIVAYGSFLGATVIALFSSRTDKTVGLVRYGLFALGAGIVTGSIWASVAWGRWWSWDPKETFALVTFIGYLSVLLLSKFYRERKFFRFYTAAVFIFVPLTWLVAGYFGGNHSYI